MTEEVELRCNRFPGVTACVTAGETAILHAAYHMAVIPEEVEPPALTLTLTLTLAGKKLP